MAGATSQLHRMGAGGCRALGEKVPVQQIPVQQEATAQS